MTEFTRRACARWSKRSSDMATVTVVAPSQERSATAQSLTLRQPIYCDQIAEREYSVEGTPADAMILAFHTLLKEKPDIVVSGINPGGNLGENIYYSGTVGAAMEAAHQPHAGRRGFRGFSREGFRFRAGGALHAQSGAGSSARRAAARRAAERQRAAAVERSGALHAPILENHAQPAPARNRSPRTPLFLAARAAIHRRHRAGHRSRRDPRRRRFHHSAGARSHAHALRSIIFRTGRKLSKKSSRRWKTRPSRFCHRRGFEWPAR